MDGWVGWWMGGCTEPLGVMLGELLVGWVVGWVGC